MLIFTPKGQGESHVSLLSLLLEVHFGGGHKIKMKAGEGQDFSPKRSSSVKLKYFSEEMVRLALSQTAYCKSCAFPHTVMSYDSFEM